MSIRDRITKLLYEKSGGQWDELSKERRKGYYVITDETLAFIKAELVEAMPKKDEICYNKCNGAKVVNIDKVLSALDKVLK